MHALVAAGSNLGERGATLRAALACLGRLPRTRLLRCSSLHATPPERPEDGGPFLNAAALLETELPPAALMAELLRLERRFGRRRDRGRGPRTLDLDLILLGSERCATRGLILPHPRFRGRRFVLAPAAEVAPGLRDPVTGHTIAALLAALEG